MTTSSPTKCVILTTQLKWGSHINFLHVTEATRGMHWATAAKRDFKSFINLFFYNTQYPNTKLVKDFRFSTSIVHNCSNTVIYYIFISKRFVSFDFGCSLISHTLSVVKLQWLCLNSFIGSDKGFLVSVSPEKQKIKLEPTKNNSF